MQFTARNTTPQSRTDTDNMSADSYSAWNRQTITLFTGHYLRNRSNLDIGVLIYIGIL
jgi:hypothetical protein